MSKTLTEASIDELVAELHNRGHAQAVVSVWTKEDTRTAIDQDDDLPDLTPEQMDLLASNFLEHLGGKLTDILGQRGNEFIDDMWAMERSTLLADVLPKPAP